MNKLIDITAVFMMVSVGIYFAVSTIIGVDKNYYRPDECTQQVDILRYMG